MALNRSTSFYREQSHARREREECEHRNATMSLHGLEGRSVAVRVAGVWSAGVVKWGGKTGLRVVTSDGRQIQRRAISEVVCLP
jgi:hypothetical protein